MSTHLSSSILHVVSECSDSERGLSLKGFPFSEANEGFMVAAFSQEVERFHMEVCLESFTWGLATVEPVTLTSIVLIKYEDGELLNNYYSYYGKGQILHACFRLEKNRIRQKNYYIFLWPPETLIKGRMKCKSKPSHKNCTNWKEKKINLWQIDI